MSTYKKLLVYFTIILFGTGAVVAIYTITTFFIDINKFFMKEQVFSILNVKLPQLISYVSKEVPYDTTTNIEGMILSFRTEPEKLQIGVPIKLIWSITERNGQAISLDRSIHRLPMHAYISRNDLGDNIKHIHPEERNKNYNVLWDDVVEFSTGGFWNIVMQFSKDGTAYHITTPVFVDGKGLAEQLIGFEREKILGERIVRLNSNPEKILIDIPTTINFEIIGNNKVQPHELDGGHNIIFALQDSSFLWNMHGDRSVENISQVAGITIKRNTPTELAPFSYSVTFPKPGVWLIHFEILTQPARFFVNVEEGLK